MLAASLFRIGQQEAPALSYLDTQSSSNSNSLSKTFSFGDVGKGLTRYLLLIVTGGNTGSFNTDFTITATVGGISATQKAFKVTVSSLQLSFAWIGVAAVPSGITGTVAVTLVNFSGTMNAIKASLLRVVGLSSTTPTETKSDTDGSVSMTVMTNGFGLIGAADNGVNATSGSFSGTNITTVTATTTGAHGYRTTAGTQTHSSSQSDAIVSASFEFI